MSQKRVKEECKNKDAYKNFPCDICGGNKTIEVPHCRIYTNGQVLHICQTCGFIYVKKRRSCEKVAQVWSKELFGKAYTSKTPLMLARHTYIAEFINQNIGLKGKEVCDIGAGEGQFLNLINKNYKANVFGIEPSEFNCQLMEKAGVKNFLGTLEDYVNNPIDKGYKADIVTMMWTLENSTSPKDLVAGAHKILKAGGHLIIATGSRILVPFSKPLSLYLTPNPLDTHPSRFSEKTLSALLLRCGFRATQVNPYLNDSLVLCLIAKKIKPLKNAKIKGDDPGQIRDFFKRWHKETMFYTKKK